MDNKKIPFVALGAVLIIAAVVAFFYFSKTGQAPTESPAFGSSNPLEKKPDLNPTDKTNPFTAIKTNPFE